MLIQPGDDSLSLVEKGGEIEQNTINILRVVFSLLQE